MDRLRLLFKIAYAFSGATFILVLLTVLGFVIRWCGWSFLPWLSHNAGYVGYVAVATTAGCFISMLKAAQLAQELQGEREAAAKQAAATVDKGPGTGA